MLVLSAWILYSNLTSLLAPDIAAGSDGAPTTSPTIRSMLRAVRAPSLLTCSSFVSRRTLDTTQMLVISEWNSKPAALWFFMAQSWISFSVMLPTSIGNPLTMTYKSTNISCETVVVCVVDINLDFKNFTHTIARGVKSILLITRSSSLAQDAPFYGKCCKYFVLSLWG